MINVNWPPQRVLRLTFRLLALLQGENALIKTLSYIKHLSNKLDNLVFTLASYNAGVRNVSKWSKRYPTKIPEKFIEQIPFYETRNYVKKVLSNYIVYEYIINGKVINYPNFFKKL